VSVCVQALPSLQVVPLGLIGFEHAPVDELHEPGSWHESVAGHCRGEPLEQTPFWQVSACVQALLSLQAVPLGLIGFEQTPVAVLHVPMSWHWSAGGQLRAIPVHWPCTHLSFDVHMLPSSQLTSLL
jgi:hypothetical protein